MYHVLCWFIILFRLLSVIVTFYSEFQTVLWRPETRKCSAAQGPHSEVVSRAFWRLVSKSCDNARVRLQEVVRQNGGHIEHVLHSEQFSILWGVILYQVSNACVIIKMCYVHNQWYDISCATLYEINFRVLFFLRAYVNAGTLKVQKSHAFHRCF